MEERRTFLKKGLGIATLGMLGTAARGETPPGAASPRYVMVIDLNKCNGCQSCVIACKARNRTAPGYFLTKVLEVETPGPSSFTISFNPVNCNQCEDPPCVPACPEKATYKLGNGIVFTDWKLCKGFGDCVDACPYGARSLDSRFDNRVDKCDFCLDRIEAGLPPACVENCPPGARIFGDRGNPGALLSEYLSRNDLEPARPEFGIKTSVLYVPRSKKSEK